LFKLIIVGCLLLVGCATPVPSKPQLINPREHWAEHQLMLSQLTDWQVQGRIAIAHQGQGTNARFKWHQFSHWYQIQFLTPLGSQAAVLTGAPQQVIWETAQGDYQLAASAEQILSEVANLNMPVSSLRYWIKGLADPNLPLNHYQLNALGYLSGLTQQDWQIQYPNYRQYGALQLPQKITISRADLKLKLMLQHWQLSPSAP